MKPFKLYVFNEINMRRTILKIDIPTKDSAPDGASWCYSTGVAFTNVEVLEGATVSPRYLGMHIRHVIKQIPRSMISEAAESQLVTEAIELLQIEAAFWQNVEHSTPPTPATIAPQPETPPSQA